MLVGYYSKQTVATNKMDLTRVFILADQNYKAEYVGHLPLPLFSCADHRVASCNVFRLFQWESFGTKWTESPVVWQPFQGQLRDQILRAHKANKELNCPHQQGYKQMVLALTHLSCPIPKILPKPLPSALFTILKHRYRCSIVEFFF